MVHTVIVGMGDMAFGLCHLFKNHNYDPGSNTLEVTKPGLSKRFLKSNRTFHDTGVHIAKMSEALKVADIIILAIPSHELKHFLNDYYISMKDKILVDITNSSIPGEDLHAMLGLTDARWVKAFNDNGAVDILLNKPYYKRSTTTIMCGKDLKAVHTVKKFAEDALGFDVKIVPFARYLSISMNQNSLGKDWVHAAYVMMILFVLTEVYALVRYNVWKGYDWFHLPVQVTNKAICWTSLNAFALSMVPGLMARFHDTIYGNKMLDKPRWMRWGFEIRKPLGLLALWFLGIHIVMSLLIFNQKYYGKFFIDPKAYASKLNRKGEFSFFFGTIGAALYFLLGVCSLPSVGSQMTSRSWQLVYGPVAWIALMFGTTHVLAMGVQGWPQQETWPGNLPPITLMSVLIPMLVIFLKLVQIFFTQASGALIAKPSYDSNGEDDSTSSAPHPFSPKTSHRSATSSRSTIENIENDALLKHGDTTSIQPVTSHGNVVPHYGHLEGSYRRSITEDMGNPV